MSNTKKHRETVNPVYVLLAIAAVMVGLGILLSWFFVSTISNLIFEHKIEPYVLHIDYHIKEKIFKENTAVDWQSKESQKIFEEFFGAVNTLGEIKRLNVFSPEEILLFSTTNKNIGKEDRDEDILEALSTGKVVHKTTIPEEDARDIGIPNLSEIYIPIKTNQGEIAGVVEMYFDQSILVTLAKKLQLFVAVFIFISIVIIVTILYAVLRKQNITMTRQAKELSHIIEKSPVGIYTVNKEGIIDSFNPKMVDLSGAKNANEVIGTDALELQTHKDRGLDVLMRKGLEGQPFDIETPYISHINRKETYRHYYGVPIFNHNNKTVEKLLVLVEDVTEHKRLESELEKYNKSLEITVTARTQELQEKLKELYRLNDIMVDRELKMVELKKQVQKLTEQLNNTNNNTSKSS